MCGEHDGGLSPSFWAAIRGPELTRLSMDYLPAGKHRHVMALQACVTDGVTPVGGLPIVGKLAGC